MVAKPNCEKSSFSVPLGTFTFHDLVQGGKQIIDIRAMLNDATKLNNIEDASEGVSTNSFSISTVRCFQND